MKRFRELHDEYLTVPDPQYTCTECGCDVYEDDNLILFEDKIYCDECFASLPVCINCGVKLVGDDEEEYMEGYFCNDECHDHFKWMIEPVGTV